MITRYDEEIHTRKRVNSHEELKEGDLVTIINSGTYLYVVPEPKEYMYLKPLDMNRYTASEYATSLMLVTSKEGNIKMNQLLQIKDTDKYGYQLAVNSQGKVVFEVKGSNEILTVDKDDLVKVIPYTVTIKFLTNTSEKEYAYLAKEGQVNKGDILVVNNSLAIVTKVNSQSEHATKELTGYRIPTVEI